MAYGWEDLRYNKDVNSPKVKLKILYKSNQYFNINKVKKCIVIKI